MSIFDVPYVFEHADVIQARLDKTISFSTTLEPTTPISFRGEFTHAQTSTYPVKPAIPVASHHVDRCH